MPPPRPIIYLSLVYIYLGVDFVEMRFLIEDFTMAGNLKLPALN